MLKILIFDRRIENLISLCEKIERRGFKITVAENGSKFLAALLTEKFNAVIISKRELTHYNCTEKNLLKKIKQNIVICSYSYDKLYSIKQIKIINPKFYETNSKIEITKTRLEEFFLTFKTKDNPTLTDDFIYKLPKKAGILLQHLILNKEKGITDTEISHLFWGNHFSSKKHCIYNHIYNLKKLLKKEFKGNFIIYKDNNRYKLVNLQTH